MIYAFGEYELDITCYELRRSGQPQQIEPKVFDLLAYLVQQRDRAVSKDELFEQVWSNQFVSESALLYCIMAARKVLGDNGRVQRLIKTIHGRGYRFRRHHRRKPVSEASRACRDGGSSSRPGARRAGSFRAANPGG